MCISSAVSGGVRGTCRRVARVGPRRWRVRAELNAKEALEGAREDAAMRIGMVGGGEEVSESESGEKR